MKHKWHKEIKCFIDGGDVERKNINGDEWYLITDIGEFSIDYMNYRIKPQPKEDWVMICKKCGDEIGIVYESKEPQYLYVHRTNEGDITFEFGKGVGVVGYQYIGKIKLEDE